MTMLVWLDLETTGLDPRRDMILEIAMSVSNSDSPFEAEPIYHRVFGHPSLGCLEPVVAEMHTANGLIGECTKIWTETNLYGHDAAETQLLGLICYTPNDLPILAGSTVHFDRSFLKVYMPEFEQRFSHRHFDVSSLKMFARMLGMPDPPKTPAAHRAREDVLESIRAGKAITQWVVDKVTRVR